MIAGHEAGCGSATKLSGTSLSAPEDLLHFFSDRATTVTYSTVEPVEAPHRQQCLRALECACLSCSCPSTILYRTLTVGIPVLRAVDAALVNVQGDWGSELAEKLSQMCSQGDSGCRIQDVVHQLG